MLFAMLLKPRLVTHAALHENNPWLVQAAADRLEVEQKLHKKSQKSQKSMKEVREEGLAAPIATDNKYGAQAAKRSQIIVFNI